MPYALPLTHFRAEGVIGATAATPVEAWSFGFHLSGAMLPDGYDAVLPGCWAAVAALIGRTDATGAMFHPQVWLTEVMAASKGADGKLQAGFYSRYSEGPVNGKASQASSAAVPFQTALAVTLDAGKPAAGRFNRFYLPVPAGGDLQVGLLTTDRALGYATAARTMLNAVSFAMNLDGITVASARWGTNRPPEVVKVGRVPDTVRSRRTSLVEDYQIQPFPS